MNQLYPDFSKNLDKIKKEELLKQKGIVLWFTGLSGSGKSTIAQHLEIELFKRGVLTQILDGDNIRTRLNSDLGFTLEDRQENIRRIAEVARLFKDCGIITLCCFISPTREMRGLAETIIGQEEFFEIFVDAPLSVCEYRDVKGLYKKARSGKIKDFTGIDSKFEEPEMPSLILKTNELSIQEAVGKCLDLLTNMN